VSDAFSARLQLHQAELAQLQQRVAGIQQSLKSRAALGDQIIDRRVKDLLDPDLQWESTSRPPDGTSATVAWAQSKSGAAQPSAAMRFRWGPEAIDVLQALGLRVEVLVGDDAPEPRLAGALRITAINVDSPAAQLRVGDIIVSLQSTGSLKPGQRSVEMRIRRGNEEMPVSVVLLELPRNMTGAAPLGPQAPTIDLAAARAIRDKLRERWDAVETLYQGGRVDLYDVIRAANDLGEAEQNAVENEPERIAALKQHVERLKQVQSVVDAKYQADVEPVQNKLAIDAEVLKAEAQFAAASKVELGR
jgi:hypothetical protein